MSRIMFQDGFFDYVMSGAKGTKMPRGDKTHIMLYPIPRFSETQLLKFIEYNKISFGEGGRMRSLSRVSRKQRYNTLDFASKIVCQQGCSRPYWKPSVKGGAGLRWRPQSVKRFEALTEPTGETSPLNAPYFLRREYPNCKNCSLAPLLRKYKSHCNFHHT